MSSQIEKLRDSINIEYAKLFDINLMKSSGFIPVDKRLGEFFVIVKKTEMNNKIIWDKHLLLIIHTFRRLYHLIQQRNTKMSLL